MHFSGLANYFRDHVSNTKSMRDRKVKLEGATIAIIIQVIWYALQQLLHLLHDVHFVIPTDHENLTRAYSTGSAKVFRSRMFMQEFS
jgi:hypothetical protein